VTARFPPAFRSLLGAAGVSAVGTGMTVTAIPLLVVAEDGSAAGLGLVAAIGALPGAVLALPAGAMADRFDRLRLLMLADLTRAVGLVAAVVAIVAVGPSVVLAGALALMLGLGDAVFAGTAAAFVPATVRSEQLDDANGKLSFVTDTGSEFVGPPLGSWTFMLAPWLPFLIDAATFLGSAMLLLGVRQATTAAGPDDPEPDDPDPDTAPEDEVGGGLRPALAVVRSSMTLRTLAVALGVVAACGGAVITLLVLVVRDRLDLDPGWYGVLLTVIAAGATVAGLVHGGLRRRWTGLDLLIAAVAVNALSYVLLAAAGSWPLAVVAMLAWGFSVTTGSIAGLTIRQRLTPDALRGRVLGLFGFALQSGAALGSLLGGLAASVTSVGLLLQLAAGIQVVVVAVLVARRARCRAELTPALV
jgi:predicted MFS family arabinose efflux permease